MLFKKKQLQEDHYLELAARGERAGLEYLVGMYNGMAYNVAMRILKNREDAEEVVQDSFLKAFKHLSDFRRASKFSTWLYRIVYYTALNRKHERQPIIQEFDSESDIINGHPSADFKSHNADRSKYLNIAMDGLGTEDRVIVALFYLAEKSIAEISQITGLGNSAIKMRLLRSRKQLEQQLKTLLNKEARDL